MNSSQDVSSESFSTISATTRANSLRFIIAPPPLYLFLLTMTAAFESVLALGLSSPPTVIVTDPRFYPWTRELNWNLDPNAGN